MDGNGLFHYKIYDCNENTENGEGAGIYISSYENAYTDVDM